MRSGDGSQQRSKRCFRCKRVLPMRAFHKHKREWDGHQYQCKSCATLFQREWRARKAAATGVSDNQ